MGSSATDMHMGVYKINCLLGLLCSLLALQVLLSSAQEGFISIDCGSPEAYTSDQFLDWDTDEAYISTGTNEELTYTPDVDNSLQMGNSGVFSQSQSKHCYVVPVTQGTSYLIRAGFYFGDVATVPAVEYTFNLAVDSTVMAGVSVNASNVDVGQFFEFSTLAASTNIDFCIIPLEGIAFISYLVFRPLATTMPITTYLSTGYNAWVLERSSYGVQANSGR